MTDMGNKREQLVSREAILSLLSNDEIAKVSTGEDAHAMAAGDDYVDLLRLDLGVQTAKAVDGSMVGHALARRDVHPATWTKILAMVGK